MLFLFLFFFLLVCYLYSYKCFLHWLLVFFCFFVLFLVLQVSSFCLIENRCKSWNRILKNIVFTRIPRNVAKAGI